MNSGINNVICLNSIVVVTKRPRLFESVAKACNFNWVRWFVAQFCFLRDWQSQPVWARNSEQAMIDMLHFVDAIFLSWQLAFICALDRGRNLLARPAQTTCPNSVRGIEKICWLFFRSGVFQAIFSQVSLAHVVVEFYRYNPFEYAPHSRYRVIVDVPLVERAFLRDHSPEKEGRLVSFP